LIEASLVTGVQTCALPISSKIQYFFDQSGTPFAFPAHSSEQERPDALPTREDLLDNQLELDAKYFVFSNETLASCKIACARQRDLSIR
jgi:hypothetical protein